MDADQGDDLEADEEELDASPEQQRAFRMSVLMRDDDVSDSDGSGDDDDVENGHANGSPKAGGVVSNPLAKAAGKNRNQRHMQIALEPKQLGETTSRKSSMVKRRRGGIASGTAGFHSDVDRCQRAIKRISGLLECEISDSIVTLGILLLVLIYEGQQMKKGDDSKFGESLKFRCTYALEQHTRPLKQGWLKKQGEMGEAFKQRWFALFPDIWTYGQDSTKYGRIMAFYRSEPRSLEERCSPKGAIMLSQDQYTITLVGDQMSLVSESPAAAPAPAAAAAAAASVLPSLSAVTALPSWSAFVLLLLVFTDAVFTGESQQDFGYTSVPVFLFLSCRCPFSFSCPVLRLIILVCNIKHQLASAVFLFPPMQFALFGRLKMMNLAFEMMNLVLEMMDWHGIC